MNSTTDPAPTERDIDNPMCSEYPLCGLSQWSCDALQDIVYESDASKRRDIALKIRQDMAKATATHYRQKFEKLITSAKPEENSHGDAHPYSCGYNVALDDYEAQLRAKLKEEL